jgi:hypothetical protein
VSLLGTIGLIFGAIVAIFAVLVLVGASRLRRARKAYEARVAAAGEAVLSGQANFFGQASAGKSQIRGLGTLVLTETELVFVQLVPARELRVSRESITSTGVTRHFLGKTQGRDLLVVTWDVNGMGDAAAFDTPNIDAWRSKLS